jgi:hypothetical protein
MVDSSDQPPVPEARHSFADIDRRCPGPTITRFIGDVGTAVARRSVLQDVDQRFDDRSHRVFDRHRVTLDERDAPVGALDQRPASRRPVRLVLHRVLAGSWAGALMVA